MGGLAYLGALVQNVPTAANIRHYATIVRERSILRQLAAHRRRDRRRRLQPAGPQRARACSTRPRPRCCTSPSRARAASSTSRRSGTLLDRRGRAHRGRSTTATIRPTSPASPPASPTSTGRPRACSRATSSSSPDGRAWARPRSRSTSASTSRSHVKLPVAVFSMEMGATQLAMRMIGSVGRLDRAARCAPGGCRPTTGRSSSGALGRLNEAPILIDETPALTAHRAARARAAPGASSTASSGSSSSTTCS